MSLKLRSKNDWGRLDMTSEWNHFALGEITELVIDYRGKTPRKLGGDWCKQGYRALSAKNIKTGRIVQAETIRYIDESLYRKWMKDEVQRGDILITSEAPFGQIFFWDSDEKIVLSQRLFCVRIKPEYDARFIYYYMTTPEFQSELDGRATGTTVIGLRQPELMKCIIRCPEIQEQKAIAAILSSIDAKIIANEKVNDNLQQQAFSVFDNLIANAENNDYTVSDYAFLNPKRTLAKNQVARSIDMSQLSTSGAFPSGWEMKPFNGGMRFTNGDTLLARITPCLENGKTAFIDFLDDGEVAFGSTEYIVLAPKNDTPPEMLYCLARYPAFVDYAVKNMNGSSGRQRVSAETVGQYRLPLFDKHSLVLFKEVVSPMFLKMRYNSLENMRLAELRDALLPKLMSGEIDVSAVQL